MCIHYTFLNSKDSCKSKEKLFKTFQSSYKHRIISIVLVMSVWSFFFKASWKFILHYCWQGFKLSHFFSSYFWVLKWPKINFVLVIKEYKPNKIVLNNLICFIGKFQTNSIFFSIKSFADIPDVKVNLEKSLTLASTACCAPYSSCTLQSCFLKMYSNDVQSCFINQ